MDEMEKVANTLNNLYQSISEKGQYPPLSFREFMNIASETPDIAFRNIFRLFYDMIHSYVGEGVDEYPDDPESINYVNYDCSRLFEKGSDHPFFADRLFANRLINLTSFFCHGNQQNRIYIFEGPHGCGKSTFLNNLLMKFEQFTKTDEGSSFDTVWRLEKEKLGLLYEHEAHAILTQLRSLVDNSSSQNQVSRDNLINFSSKKFLEVPCPSHDHPLLMIPKSNRKEFLNDLIKDEEFKKRLFSEKQYEWVFRDNPCTICVSLYQTLLERLDSPSDIFDMIFARRYQFNRRLGEGISVFNPGDRSAKTKVMTNQLLQNQLNSLLKDSNRVRYIYSRYAKTNNGIYALMDIKANNRERFTNLHGIISEGVHKVEDIEENVNSLFLALINPEDRENITEAQSFSDRITYIKIPYVLDYNTEVKIYLNAFGDRIAKNFLPRILQNFAKVIIATRLKPRSDALIEWIVDPDKYQRYCDNNLHLLKMDIYTGIIPTWLSEEDRKKFTAKRRKRIIAESEAEGDSGFSGRDSLKIFNEFYSSYVKKNKLITMAMVYNFFKKNHGGLNKFIPYGFLESLVRLYDYTVLQEVKEALYYYNEERISRDIQNYLFGINFETGVTERCVYTGELLEITDDFYKDIELRFLGALCNEDQRKSFRKDIQNQYTSATLTQEIILEGKSINQTNVYRALRERYVHNLKEKVMDPFLNNDNFRRAVKDYSTESFKTYDKRIREEVSFLMKNLKDKNGYTEQGAKEVCIYVIDNDLARKFA
jgi:predicted Ser/Thr protein kinase